MPDFSNPADEVSARALLSRLDKLEQAVDSFARAQKEAKPAPGTPRRAPGTRPGRTATTAAEEVTAEERLNRLRERGFQIADRERRTKQTTTLYEERQARAAETRLNLLREGERVGATPGGIYVPPARRAVGDPGQLAGRSALAEIEAQLAARQAATFQAVSQALQRDAATAAGSGARGLGGRTPTYAQAVRGSYTPPALAQLGARQTATEVGALGTQFQRGGALGTEFFDALRVGAVTLADVRWQLTQTIFKFGGWLVAGSAVFFAADALRELGSGALDSLEGVNTLQRIFPRIDTERAQQEFRNLAGTMNLPIQDVADAAYGISKVFGSIRDPAEALQATLAGTRAALFAMKVGELDAGTATRYFSAIIQGFKLDFRDLPDLVDTANQAQNRFGGSLPQIIQGVAQASGQFGALGGNYRELIALIQTGTRVTGRTGSEIGTGIQRTAEILTRPERRTRIIDLLGIDPQDHTITEVLERAMQVVRHSSRETQTEIARAISTPQLASGRILPILRSGALYREIQQQLSPDRVQGSAQRELNRALQGPREQLRALSVNLQRLGSSLAQSGVLDGLGLMLRTLNATLRVANALVETFTSLPRPLRTAAATLVEIAAVMALMRRFGAIPGLRSAGGNRAGPLPLPVYSPASAGGTGTFTGTRQVATVYGGAATNLSNASKMSQFERSFRTAGASLYESAEGLKRGGAAGRFLGSAVQNASRAAVGFGASMTRLALTEISGFDAAIIATIEAYTLYQRARERQDAANREAKRLDQLILSGTPQQLRAQKKPEPSFGERALDFLSRNAPAPFAFLPRTGEADTKQEAYEAGQRTAAIRERAQARGIDLTQDQVRQHLRDRLAGAHTAGQKQAAINQAWFELNHSLARQAGVSADRRATAAETEDRIQQIVVNLRAVSGNFQTTLDNISEYTQAQGLEQALENAISVRGLTGRNAGRAAAASARFRELAANAQTPKDTAKFLQLADQLDQAIDQQAKQILDRALEFSRTPGESHAARQSYLGTQYRRYVGGAKQQLEVLRRRVRSNNEDIKQAQRELEGLATGPQQPQDANPLLGSELGRLPGVSNEHTAGALAQRRKRLEDRIKTLKSSRNRKKNAIDDLESELRQNREDYDYLKQQMARDDFTEATAASQALYDVRIASTDDPITRARLTVAKARANLQDVRDGFRKGFKNLADLRQALAGYRDSLRSVAQEIISDYQSQQGVDAARYALTTRDPVSLARNAEQQARDLLAKIRATPGHDKSAERDALRGLLEARKNTQDAIRQEAEAMIQANAEYQLAGTDDPVRQARINLRAAERVRRAAPGESPSARRRQQASVRQYRRTYLQAKQQSAYDDIEFEASIGRITQETELARLQAFVKTIRSNQALRRQVLQRIYQLKKELEQSSEVELNVGDIRLPTIYDVRRLAKMGTQSQMNVRQDFQITVNGAGDAEAVGNAVFSRFAEVSTSGVSSAARAQGME